MPLYPPAASLASLLDQGVRFWYRLVMLATAPVSYWRFGEASGTVATDEMAANDGTYTGSVTLGVAGLLTGDPDTAVTTGSGAVSLGTGPFASLLSGTQSFTVGGWVSHTPDGTSRPLFTNVIDGNNAIYLDSRSAAIYYTRTVAGDVGAVYATALSAGTHFVLLRYDGVNIEVWVDGVLTTGAFGGMAQTASAGSFPATAAATSIISTLDGPGDEFAFWSRALSATEIAALYRIGSGT